MLHFLAEGINISNAACHDTTIGQGKLTMSAIADSPSLEHGNQAMTVVPSTASMAILHRSFNNG